jgi:hypothetical protein
MCIVLWLLAWAATVTIRFLGPHYLLLGLTYIAATAALVCGLASWFVSRSGPPIEQNANRRKWRAKPKKRSWGPIGLFGLFLITVVMAQETWRKESTRGFLLPAGDRLPAPSCGAIPADSIALDLGTIVSVVPKKGFPHSVLSINQKDRIVLHRRWDGGVAISLDIYDISGKKLGQVTDNEFSSLRSDTARVVVRDRSTLVVSDRHGLELLRLRYLNPSAIKLEAFLSYPDSGPLQIKGDSSQAPCVYSRTDLAEFRVQTSPPK